MDKRFKNGPIHTMKKNEIPIFVTRVWFVCFPEELMDDQAAQSVRHLNSKRERSPEPEAQNSPPQKIQKIAQPVNKVEKMQLVMKVNVKMPTGEPIQIEVEPTNQLCLQLKNIIIDLLPKADGKSYHPNQLVLSLGTASFDPEPLLFFFEASSSSPHEAEFISGPLPFSSFFF